MVGQREDDSSAKSKGAAGWVAGCYLHNSVSRGCITATKGDCGSVAAAAGITIRRWSAALIMKAIARPLVARITIRFESGLYMSIRPTLQLIKYAYKRFGAEALQLLSLFWRERWVPLSLSRMLWILIKN